MSEKLWGSRKRLTDSPTHRLTDSPTHRLIDSPTHRLTDSCTRPLSDDQNLKILPLDKRHKGIAKLRSRVESMLTDKSRSKDYHEALLRDVKKTSP